MDHVRSAFLEAIEAARDVLVAPETRERWEQPSVLAAFSVRGLAGHLARAATTVVGYAAAPEPEGEPIPAARYFAGLRPAPDVESTVAVSIRQRGEEMAASGVDALVTTLDSARAELKRLFDMTPPTQKVKVYGDQVMRLDDYLLTRIVELLVHTDDLAASVGLASPALPERAVDLALCHLLDVARLRNGDLAVLRAFSRRERDNAQALRIF